MVAPESLSAVPAVTAGSLPVTPSIVAGSLSATPPITTGSLSATPAVAAGSLSATTAVALAETAKALESLSAPHLPKIPTMGLSNPVVDTVRSFGELLTPLLEKVKPFCDLMTAISKVSDGTPTFYGIAKILHATGTSLCANRVVDIGRSAQCKLFIISESSLPLTTCT